MKKQNLNLVFNLAILVMIATFFIGVAMGEEENTGAMSGNAIMIKTWMEYAEWFVILTSYPAVIMMLFISLSLHVARPMVIRYLNRMTLRLGADILWEAWIIGRDVMILAAVAFLGVLILPRLQEEWFTGVLIPAFVLGLITLVFKLVTDTDADKRKYIIATGLTALTLIAATVPYAIGSVWHDKGHEKFQEEFFVPLTRYDLQQKTTGVTATDIIKDVKDTMNSAVNAMQKGDTGTAVFKAQEADAAHDKLGDSLNTWNSTKNSQIEDAFNDLMGTAKKGDVAGMKAAQDKINQILDEFKATALGGKTS